MQARVERTESGTEGAFAIGDQAPELSLSDTSGEVHSLPAPGEAGATVIAWTCNHCPYALAWHDRLLAVARDFADRGVRVLLVNSNDPERYPADSLEMMRERVEQDGGWPAPYLHDESQEAAREWGAQTTPDVYVLDSDLVLRYRGAPDADYEDPALDAAWVRDALERVLAGEAPEPAETDSVGCSIKWRS